MGFWKYVYNLSFTQIMANMDTHTYVVATTGRYAWHIAKPVMSADVVAGICKINILGVLGNLKTIR